MQRASAVDPLRPHDLGFQFSDVPDHPRGRVSRKTCASFDYQTSARSADSAGELDYWQRRYRKDALHGAVIGTKQKKTPTSRCITCSARMETKSAISGAAKCFMPQRNPVSITASGIFVDPVWGLLDKSPDGRGDFFPKLSYE